MKKLIIAEKPSVARDIARVLGVKGRAQGYLEGDDYVVTWALGHLVSLAEPDELDPRYKRWNMADLPIMPEEIPLKVLPRTRAQFSVVKKLMNDKEIASLICATDAAREGELIFRYIYQMARCKKPVERLWISSMTDQAIRQGFSALRPASEYDALYESAKMRSLADWLVGMNASRAFTLRYGALLPMGRVQTPTLALLVERDLEISRFVSKDYWEIRADFGDYAGVWQNPETNDGKCPDKDLAETVRRDTQGKTGRVEESVREKKHTPPPQLYDLTALQRAANARFGFSADKTLKTLQELYEKYKLVTYPRTDSRYLPDDMQKKLLSALDNLPEPYKPLVSAPEFNRRFFSKRVYDAKKVSDHHAILPTEKRADLSALSPDLFKIYDMVTRSAIAVHYPDYEYESAKITTRVNGHAFKSAGTTPISPGWRALYPKDGEKADEEQLPMVNVGDARTAEKVAVKKLKTKPPSPHTDATLLSAMENAGRSLADDELRERMKSSGLGTPATRAATIERLLHVGLAKRKGKALVSTEKGQKLISVAPAQISSAATTGKWEKALYEMANQPDAALRAQKSTRFHQGIMRFSAFLVDAAKNAPANVKFDPDPQKKRPAKSTGGKKA